MKSDKKFNSIPSFLWEIIKPYKFHYLMQIIAPVYTGILELIYFYCVKLFIDVITQDTFSYNELTYPLIIFFTAPILLNVFWRIANILEWKSAPFVRKQILLNAYDYIQHHSYHFFQNNLSGNIVSKIKGMLEGYEILFYNLKNDVCMFGTMLITATFGIFLVNVKIGIFMCLWLIAFFFIMYKMTKKFEAFVYVETQSKHNIIGLISDKITNIISLLHFATRKNEYNSLKQHITKDFIAKQVRTCKYDFKVQLTMWTLYMIMWAAFVFILIDARKTNIITAGTIAFTFGMIAKFSDATWILLNKIREFMRCMGDMKSSFEFLKIPHTSKDKLDAKILNVKNPVIEFKNVYFNYDSNSTIFNNFNLHINAGENIGLVGCSGAGKTSLVKLLLRFFEIQKGQILIDNEDISNVTADSLRSNISVIPQDIMLFHRTLLENIQYGNPNASFEEVVSATRAAHAHEFIKQMKDGYNTLVGERGIKLSGGQRQRIAIARAILKNAPILILDEATSSLDSRTEKDIQDSINHILENDALTVIAIAHRLSTLKHMDRIIVMDNGIIKESGTHEKLLNTEGSLYKKLWHEQTI